MVAPLIDVDFNDKWLLFLMAEGKRSVSSLFLACSVYGLTNIASFLAQAVVDSIIDDSCDEINVEYLSADDTDGIGMDDGKDQCCTVFPHCLSYC